MGRLKKGMLGEVSGKVGTIVGSTWKGKGVVRTTPDRKSNKQSDKQLVNQSKFGTGSAFIYTMGNLLDITYRYLAEDKTPRNAALSNLMKNAITGSYPKFLIDFPKVNFSIENGLHNAANASAASTLPGLVSFNWTFEGTDHSSPRDKAMLVAYSESEKEGEYNTAAAQRDDLLGHLKLPEFRGQSVHTWIIFISEDQSKISGTKYTGLVEVV